MFDCIGLACSSPLDMIHFYNLFDLDFTEYGQGHYEAQTKSGVRIMLDSYELLKKIDPSWSESLNTVVTLGFSFETASQVDQKINDLKKLGYEVLKEPWDAFWGQRYASVLDPSKNQIDLFAPLDK